MNWKDYVYISYDSPTFLRWKKDILDTRGHRTKAQKDCVAGGGSGRYKIQVGSIQEQVSRVIYKVLNGDIPEGIIIDHLDGNQLNNSPENLSLKSLQFNNQNIRKTNRNKSGKVGVYFFNDRFGTEYAEAAWYEDGKRKRTRRFSCKKYGRDKAFSLACEVREKSIKELNMLGFEYTERHGK